MADEEIKIQDNLEIQEALKEFELKSLEQHGQNPSKALKNSETSKMVELAMKYSGGLVKDQRQAEYVLLGFVVVAIAISFFLFFNTIRSPSSAPTGQNIDQSQL